MKTPFTTEDFLHVFGKYNNAIWPLQVILYLLALLAILLALKRTQRSDKIISLILPFFWLWMGIVYHLMFFTSINKAAYGFGLIFIIQGLLFSFYGVYLNHLSFQFHRDVYGITGLILLVFALLLYPLIGHLSGHSYPFNPTFGLPCPTTIFTFGLLFWTDRKINFALLFLPLLWSFIGFWAAFGLGIFEDIGLLVSGLTALMYFFVKNKSYNMG